jgi:hypothetical protein
MDEPSVHPCYDLFEIIARGSRAESSSRILWGTNLLTVHIKERVIFIEDRAR